MTPTVAANQKHQQQINQHNSNDKLNLNCSVNWVVPTLRFYFLLLNYEVVCKYDDLSQKSPRDTPRV